MNKLSWPRLTVLTGIVSFVLFIALTWLWYFAGNSFYGMMGGWGLAPFGLSRLMVLGLMHLSFWVLLIAGMVWLVQLIGNHS